MNLYPYNYYILYIAIFALIITLIITFLKSKNLLKEINNLSIETNKLNSNLKIANEKYTLITNKLKNTIKTIKKFLPLLAFAFFAINDYKSSENKKINKSLINATKKTILKKH